MVMIFLPIIIVLRPTDCRILLFDETKVRLKVIIALPNEPFHMVLHSASHHGLIVLTPTATRKHELIFRYGADIWLPSRYFLSRCDSLIDA